MERVTYQLERSLPSLDLLATSGVFTREELRALTSQRQQYESNLVRRVALWEDFKAYLDFEERTEKLRLLRCRTLDLPKAVLSQFKSASTARTISIYERAVRKFKSQVHVWIDYIQWAKSNGMRVVLGRVLGRGLALHPQNTRLWILAADHELNANGAPTAARALLQRALRINRPVQHDAARAGGDRKKRERHLLSSQDGDRPSKKSKLNGAVVSSSRQGRKDDSASLFVPPGSKERDYLDLALEYVRMELVFMERLRRRWAILGISAEGASDELASKAAAADAMERNGEEEDADMQEQAFEAAQALNDAGKDDDEGDAEGSGQELSATAKATAASKPQPDSSVSAAQKVVDASKASAAAQLPVLQGAIIRLAVRSAVDNLPQRYRFIYLVAVRMLLASFPFADGHAKQGSGQKLRNELVEDVHAHLRTHFPHVAHASFVLGSAPISANVQLWPSSEELASEMETNESLKAASTLQMDGSDIERAVAASTQQSETQRLLVLNLMNDVLARQDMEDETLPKDVISAFKHYAEAVQSLTAADAVSSVADVSTVAEASKLAELETHFLQALRATWAAQEGPELRALVDALSEQVYISAKKSKYLSFPVAEMHFAHAQVDERDDAAEAQRIRKAIKTCSYTAEKLGSNSVATSDSAARLWCLSLDCAKRRLVQRAEPDAKDELLREHLLAVAAAPESTALWQRTIDLVSRELALRDKKADRWVWASFDTLVDNSRRSVQTCTDPEAREVRQAIHDSVLSAVFGIAARLEDARSAKTAERAMDAARAIVMKDSVASAGFWLKLCELHAARYRSLAGQHKHRGHSERAPAYWQAKQGDADSSARLSKEAAKADQIFGKLLFSSHTTDPEIFVQARITWLQHLLRDRQDVQKAMNALDTAVRDAKAVVGLRAAARIEDAWKEMSEASPATFEAAHDKGDEGGDNDAELDEE
ncbi:hypothetical protein K437DRAFT_272413 [Tilletiaria anomala UBC 951]|uniref:U3 small nucleolar RNA-associated protein 6 N-terminal domain-containing protein n=1 Tax=Tilletiaria anomala (strain ATCC 24038 / CBS 436.72 / UBC 951) TaxID=1037660 RepID=A0A066WFI5_TILAU|nr:uncharacterized protein K437DRAFT_272413 [Tilletiaria anomala UBC 951]KDN52551.1 hypothetical protein K437DRAFT_272413 [Tilletiaria anomala UBC 951]